MTSDDPQLREIVDDALERLSKLESTVELLLQGSGHARSLAERLPYPIALPLARCDTSISYQRQFSFLLDAGEAAVRYIGALSVAAVRSHRGDGWTPEHLDKPNLSLGDWAAAAREALKHIGDDDFDNVLRTSLLRANGKPTPETRYLFEEFVGLRNRERGHGVTRTEGAYEALYLRHRTSLNDALTAIKVLEYPLARIESLDRAAGQLRYRISRLTGPAGIGGMEWVDCTTEIGGGTTCAWDGSQQLLPMTGLLDYRACPDCHEEHCFHLDGGTSEARSYQAFAVNHRFSEKASNE